jgi:N-acetylglutamate synthase-like GNAT family acetyltransferase
MSKFELRPARPADNGAIRELILTILNDEYAMALTLAELPDLVDVYATYCSAGRGQFWIAQQDGKVRGCIGLMRLGRRDFELRRMYVQAAARGQGMAQRLLEVLLDWSKRNAVDAIYLETNEQWHAAHHLYEKNGFAAIAQSELPPEFPVVRVATGFYRLQVAADTTSTFNQSEPA